MKFGFKGMELILDTVMVTFSLRNLTQKLDTVQCDHQFMLKTRSCFDGRSLCQAFPFSISAYAVGL